MVDYKYNFGKGHKEHIPTLHPKNPLYYLLDHRDQTKLEQN